jgi:glucosylceramidase
MCLRPSPLRYLAAWLILVVPAAAQPSVEWWVSSSDMQHRLAAREPLSIRAGPARAPRVIRIDERRTYQSILGLGSSLEHSTCYNIRLLPRSEQVRVMESLVDAEKGIGMSLMRICIGTPDFTASPWYTYHDMRPGRDDPDLRTFSIAEDRRYVLPVLKLAIQKNPDLLFFASPWSPPAWMKTNGRICGGQIDPSRFPALAQYFIRFLRTYEAVGIDIHAITLQNEPGYCPDTYPSCCWSAEQQRDFIGGHLGPELHRQRMETKIWCYDHNFDNLDFPMTILKDSDAAYYVDGTAFHHYEGSPTAMAALRDAFPDKHVYFTEGSVFGVEGAAQIIAFLRHWARSYTAWVTIIDRKGQPNPGPHQCSPTCIVLDRENLTLEYRFDYYMYGQFMKFIRPGATRVHSDHTTPSLPNVAVRNPDGRLVVVVANLGSSETDVRIERQDKHVSARLPGASVATFRWPTRW